MATLYGPDGFTYSDGDLASVGGGNWATLSGFSNLNVATNKLKPNTSAADGAVRLASWSGSTSAQWAQLTLAAFTGGAAPFVGPTVLSDGTSTFYYCDIRDTSWAIYKVTSGSFSSLSSTSVTTAVNDVAYIDATYNGSTQTVVNVYRNGGGSPLVTATDASSPITSGRPGIRMWHADTAARLDDFSAGDFSSGSTLTPYVYRQHIGRGGQ